MPKLLGKKHKDIDRRSCRAEVLDLDVSSGKYKYRLIKTLVCRGKTVLYMDDQSSASAMASREGDGIVSLPLADRTVVQRAEIT